MKRVLLDENLDRRLKRFFSDELDVTSVPDLGWRSKTNGELLAAMREAGIAVLVTADRNLRFQQDLRSSSVVVIVLVSRDIRLPALRPLVPLVERAIADLRGDETYVEITLSEE